VFIYSFMQIAKWHYFNKCFTFFAGNIWIIPPLTLVPPSKLCKFIEKTLLTKFNYLLCKESNYEESSYNHLKPLQHFTCISVRKKFDGKITIEFGYLCLHFCRRFTQELIFFLLVYSHNEIEKT
jgi:hypothetical protein